MSGLLPGNVGFLAGAIATHALVGYTLGAVAFDSPRLGLLGGLAPDVDLLVPALWDGPFVHRGITHSALALGVAVALGVAHARSAGGGIGIGYLSHLAIDATTPTGVPLAAPFADATYAVALGGHSPDATAAIWACCLVPLWLRATAREWPHPTS